MLIKVLSSSKISALKCVFNSGFQNNIFQHAEYKVQSTNVKTFVKKKVLINVGRIAGRFAGRIACLKKSGYNEDNNDNDDDNKDDDNNDDDNNKSEFKVHLKYKVQNTKISTCVNNHDDDNDDHDNHDDHDFDNDDDKINMKKLGEIIPILFFILVLLVKNEAVILLDLEVLQYFRLSRCQMCRPYVALFSTYLNNSNDDDNDNDNNNDDNNDDNDNDEDNNDNNNQNYLSLIPEQVELILFSKLVSWLSKLLLKAGDIAENPGPDI